MATQTETLQVTGIRCERCVLRLGKALEGHDGLELANANLMGVVTLHYDEERTSLDALLEKMSNAGNVSDAPIAQFGTCGHRPFPNEATPGVSAPVPRAANVDCSVMCG